MKIALTGSLYAGKTTLARHLRDVHGFHVMNYTDSLKDLGVKTLRAAGIEVTLDSMLQDKKRYRPFLQELGTAVGYDKGFGVERCLDAWFDAGQPENVVFDNVRFASQFQKLLPYGFVLVGLVIGEDECRVRAAAKGVSPNEMASLRKHPAELGVKPDLYMDGARRTEELAEILLRLGGGAQPTTPVLDEFQTEHGDLRYRLHI